MTLPSEMQKIMPLIGFLITALIVDEICKRFDICKHTYYKRMKGEKS